MRDKTKMELIFWMFTIFAGISFVMFMIMATLVGLGMASNATYAGSAAGGFLFASIILGSCAFWAMIAIPNEG